MNVESYLTAREKSIENSMLGRNKRKLFNTIYTLINEKFDVKLGMNAHLKTFNGGIASTMTYIREKYWLPSGY